MVILLTEIRKGSLKRRIILIGKYLRGSDFKTTPAENRVLIFQLVMAFIPNTFITFFIYIGSPELKNETIARIYGGND